MRDSAFFIAAQLWTIGNMKDELLAVGINPLEDMEPSDFERQLLEEFESYAKEGGRAYALEKVLIPDFSPNANPELFRLPILQVEYKKALKLRKAENLAEKIKKSPTEVESLISEFQRRKSSGLHCFEVREQLLGVIREAEKKNEAGESLVEIPNWFVLSQMIGGFNPGRILILTGPTGLGKTTLVLNLAYMASMVMSVLFINMEMILQDIMERFICMGAGIPSADFRKGNYDHGQVAEWVHEFKNNKDFQLTDGKSLTLEEIGSLVRVKVKQNNVKLIVVDYDQKIKLETNRYTPEWKALQESMSYLEELAKELNVFILVTAQANEEGDPSASKRSKYSASGVLKFYQDGKGGPYLIEATKNRFGKQGSKIEVNYEPERSRISEKGYFTNEHARSSIHFPGKQKSVFNHS